jgi:type IV pilus assembly protein PilF
MMKAVRSHWFTLCIRVNIVLLLTLLLGSCASSQSNSDEAQSQKRKAAESNTSLGIEYMNRGRNEIALGKLKKAVTEDPSYAPGHTVLAILYEQIGEMSLSGKHYKKAIELEPKDGDINNNYGVYLCQSGKQIEAMPYFDKSLEDPFYNTPYVAMTNAGSCALRAGQLTEADEYLRRALKMNPEFPDALLSMAKLNFEEGSFLSTRAFLQRFESVSSQTPESLYLGFQNETSLNDPVEARGYQSLLNSVFPDSEEAAKARKER